MNRGAPARFRGAPYANLLVSVTLSAAAACSTSTADVADRQHVPHRTGTLATAEWETPAWELGRYKTSGARLDVVAMRSGGPIVALLQRSPLAAYEIILEGPAMQRRVSVEGGPVQGARFGAKPPLGHPLDIVGVRGDGVAWYLDADSARIVSEDVGGFHRIESSFAARTVARTGCLLGDRAVAFLDSARVDTVFVQDLGAAGTVRGIPAPRGYVDGVEARWTDLRFGGSRDGPCVLWAPRMRTVMLVSDSAVRAMGPMVEQAEEESWPDRIWRRITRKPARQYVIDASSFPGGVAVLFGGRTPGARRMIDLYDDAGTYRETMVLPMPAMRIAGSGQRLYVLRQNGDSVLLASYVLPAAVRPPTGAEGAQPGARVGRLTGARTAPRDVQLDTARVVAPRRHFVDSSP